MTMQKQALNNSVLGRIGSLIDEISAANNVKQAATDGTGSGGYKTDPGSIGGPSSHPTAKADGGNHPASYGAHGNELSADIKKDIPNSADATSTTILNQDSDYDHVQIGMKVKPTGEDPSAENAYKPHKDDPGTTHPAKVDGGEKYSSASFPDLYKMACAKIEDVLSRLGAGEKIAVANLKPASAPAAKQAADASLAQAAAAGAELADLASGSDEQIKMAAAQEVVETVLREAYNDADLVGEFLYKLAAQEEAAGMPPGMMPEGGMPPGGAEGALPPEMGGGAPPPAPGGAEGGMPPEMGGGEAGGGASDEAVNEMANALVDSGIPVDKLIAALQGAAAQQGGGAGDMGGEPAAAGSDEKTGSVTLPRAELEMLYKVANNVLAHEEAGRFRRVRRDKIANKQAQSHRDDAVDYLNHVREVLSR